MSKRKLRDYCIMFEALIGAILIVNIYFQFTSQQIYEESASHLEEIYSQVNASFSSLVSQNWRLLDSWEYYVAAMADGNPQAFEAFIEEEKADWHFTDFYFLSRDGSLLTADQRTGTLCPESGFDALAKGEKEMILEASLPDTGRVTVFAVSVKENAYQNFEYVAIALGFHATDMAKALSVTAFSGQGQCYVVHADGSILLASGQAHIPSDNYLAYLQDEAFFKEKDAAAISQDWAEGKSDTVRVDLNQMEYYLSYQPAAFGKLTILGVVPADVVNASMSKFRLVTVLVIGVIFLVLAFGIIRMFLSRDKKRIREKNLEIKARENLFDVMANNTNDIFILFSPDDFSAEYISPNLERVLGVDPETIRGDVRDILQVSVEDLGKISPEDLKSITAESTWEADIQLRHRKLNERYWFKLMLYHSNLEDSNLFVMVLSDRTNEKMMNQTLEQALEVANAANHAKSNFLSNMSHDIRTPMNAIIGIATLLERDSDKPEKVREYTRKITFSSHHLLNLINDILDMSKIESGKTSLNTEEFSLPEFLEALCDMILPQAKAKKQHFQLRTKGSLPEYVSGDKLRLNQILLNLLSNAVKYTQEGGHIELRVEVMKQKISHHSHLLFVVEDNGFGMSEEFVKNIFDPFSREITSSTKEIQGTGLGMAITKNIVELMGGTISVKSKPKAGSTFSVELELAVGRQEQDGLFWIQHGITRILVADPDEDVCLNIQELMKDTGVWADYALDGYKAAEMASEAYAAQNGYSIVLLDWKMPGIDGLEAARRIRARTEPEAPILVLSAFACDEIEEEAREAGINLLLPKPFFISSFQRVVAQLYHEGEGEIAPSQPEILSLEGIQVLAAEDNEINSEILLEIMKMEGVQCDIASNGQKAVEMFLASTPGQYDMIFMDVQMPVMDGYEATRIIRASNHADAKAIPIIAMTANAFDEDVKRALDAGMNAHTAKPIDMDKLKATIASLQLTCSIG